jgi:transcriptional regulator with XRE-family HTH domain
MLSKQMTMIKTTFGDVLRECRKKSNISQAELAFNSGLDRSYISKLETGVYQPSFSTIFATCEILNIKPADLVDKVHLKYLKQKNSE